MIDNVLLSGATEYTNKMTALKPFEIEQLAL